MTETLEFLNRLNWFLDPFSNVIIFFFTTTVGISSLLIFLLLYIALAFYDELVPRKLAYKSIGSYGVNRVPFLEKLYIFIKVIANTFFRVISNVPNLLFVSIFLILIVSLSSGISTIDEFVKNQQRIKELKSIVKQLDKRYKVAEIKVNDYDFQNDKTNLEIKFYDYAKQGFSNKKQTISIEGNDIYFDAIVLNFEYSEISTGKAKNIVLPYKVFSNKVSQNDGIELNLKDENGIPLIFKRNENEIYGMEVEKFEKRTKEIMTYITDNKKAKLAGIRSVYGNAVHKRLRKGETIIIWVEQTGGLVIKKAAIF